jgi:hypothetical protein
MKICCQQRKQAIDILISIANSYNECKIDEMSDLEKNTLFLLMSNGIGQIINKTYTYTQGA